MVSKCDSDEWGAAVNQLFTEISQFNAVFLRISDWQRGMIYVKILTINDLTWLKIRKRGHA